MKISIIIPVYNEINTIETIINKILKENFYNKEIIVVDDFSSDGTIEKIKKFQNKKDFKILFHKKNMGKGACIKTSLPYLTGDYVIIQDADLEYDPQDIHKFLNLQNSKGYKAVYGSRVLGRKKLNFNLIVNFRILANYLLTLLSNIINNQKLTDAHTCYKFISTEIFKNLNLQQNDFSICPEITTKLSKLKIEIVEIPISYSGRSYQEGKKIKLKDAFYAVSTLIKFRFFINSAEK